MVAMLRTSGMQEARRVYTQQIGHKLQLAKENKAKHKELQDNIAAVCEQLALLTASRQQREAQQVIGALLQCITAAMLP